MEKGKEYRAHAQDDIKVFFVNEKGEEVEAFFKLVDISMSNGMRMRIKKSGEIIDVLSYSCGGTRQDDDFVTYKDSYGIEHRLNLNLAFDLEPVEEDMDNGQDLAQQKMIDWEARRYQIAKTAMIAIMGNKDVYNLALAEAGEGAKCVPDVMARAACVFADALVKELKKGGEQ